MMWRKRFRNRRVIALVRHAPGIGCFVIRPSTNPLHPATMQRLWLDGRSTQRYGTIADLKLTVDSIIANDAQVIRAKEQK
jgi:hypothetical protein